MIKDDIKQILWTEMPYDLTIEHNWEERLSTKLYGKIEDKIEKYFKSKDKKKFIEDLIKKGREND